LKEEAEALQKLLPMKVKVLEKKEEIVVDNFLERELLLQKQVSLHTESDSDVEHSISTGQLGLPVIKKKNKLLLAPDGMVPNSFAGKEVNSWLEKHGRLDANASELFQKKKNTPKKKEKDQAKELKRKQYRDQLKEKMNKMIEDEKNEEEIVEVVEEPPPPEVEAPHKLRVGTPAEYFPVSLEPIQRGEVEVTISTILERWMNFDWVDLNMVLN
jgi:hypothetical protein